MSRREAGEKEKESKKARRARWEGEKENFPLPIVPLALSIFFRYCYFNRDTQGTLRTTGPQAT